MTRMNMIFVTMLLRRLKADCRYLLTRAADHCLMNYFVFNTDRWITRSCCNLTSMLNLLWDLYAVGDFEIFDFQIFVPPFLIVCGIFWSGRGFGFKSVCLA